MAEGLKYSIKLISVLLLLTFTLIVSPALARIYESPYSQEITGMPGVDNEPPVTTITISQPQINIGGNLYISNQTLISFSAIDYGIVPSGVNYTEYKIDSESSWTRYTNPFTLASYPDGQHTIYYRSTDKMQNTEQEKTATLILDKTPPATTITASDPLIEGSVNTISPRTRFTLSSSDNLSGVKEISYRIDNGAWQPYMVNFSLSGMNAGSHTITYKAADNLGNIETEKTITVRLITIDRAKKLSLNPVVLAASWLLEDDKDDDKEHHGNNDNFKDREAKDKTKALNNLINMLTSSGIDYYIPQSNDDFKETFRSGRFNAYVLVDFKSEDPGKEIREVINYGDGLVFIKTHPDESPRLNDVFGVKFHGESRHKGMTIDLIQSPISSAGSLETGHDKKVIKTEITSNTAQALGYVTDKKDTYPAIIFNQYGRGKVILFGFDLLNCPDQAKAGELLRNSINYVLPGEHYLRALGSVPINIKLNNSAEPVDIKITETIPDGTTVDTIAPAATNSGNTLKWNFTLLSNQNKDIGYWLNLPDLSGNYQTNTEAGYSNNGDYRLYGNYSLNLTIAQNSAELLQGIINDLNNLKPKPKEDREKIKEAIEELKDINQNASKRKSAEKNIERILEAIEELNETSMDMSSSRLKLDELLKIWERKWYLMPEENKKENN